MIAPFQDDPDLYPRPGDEVLPWWAKVLRWAKSLPVIFGPGVVGDWTTMGCEVTVRDPGVVRTPFRVRLQSGNQAARVTPGFVDDRVPFVIAGRGENRQVVRLDGTMADGLLEDPRGRPVIDLRQAEPGGDGRSAIVVVKRLGEQGQPIDDEEEPEALRVEHRSEFGPAEHARASREDGEGFQVLAVIYWRNEKIERVAQVTRHHLVHSWQPPDGTEGSVGRHFFSAV